MADKLKFNPDKYEVRTCELNGETITFRAFEGLDYCECPADPIQKINIYAPESYFEGGEVGGYTLKTAPIFMPNSVGGYMPGAAEEPGEKKFRDHSTGRPNSLFAALAHGYVVASAGIRGRLSPDGVGKAPALIVDMKAAIRYIRHNSAMVPGDAEKIITNGTSAGGALSALAGATGNSPDYAPYLVAIGAADERDDVFAASCYCPIHNLENADMAYEWLFNGEWTCHRVKMFISEENGQRRPVSVDAEMTDEQKAMSDELAAMFPAYVNSLGLKDAYGEPLELDEDGNGTFSDFVASYVMESAQHQLDTHETDTYFSDRVVEGCEVEKQDFLQFGQEEDGRKIVYGFDWDGYVHAITRMKEAPAFDGVDLNTPENSEFGTAEVPNRHFTEFSMKHSKCGGEMADPQLVKMLNPLKYIGEADTAPNWRIRHGAYDRDTSIAIPVILATTLQNKGYSVDFMLPWGIPHSGDYDLKQLFEWIDGICR